MRRKEGQGLTPKHRNLQEKGVRGECDEEATYGESLESSQTVLILPFTTM